MTGQVQWWVPVTLIGISFGFWLLVGSIRLIAETGLPGRRPFVGTSRLRAGDVAILIPAHNEEASIRDAIWSALEVVDPSQIHVVADGCIDRTAVIARGLGAQVLELTPARGKAGGIDAAVTVFDMPRRYEIMMIVDADTRIDRLYVLRALRLFDDEEVVAIAGYARTEWRPSELTSVGRFLVSYRTRLYTAMQWMKYGQTWRHTNVTPIVPGFASMYRTRVLNFIDINPPGLVIEDFNMTFELHHKKLGRVAFEPSVFGTTQDPDNLPDYWRQVTRWWLGFWQTLGRHGLWVSWFSAALVLFLLEVLLATIVIIVIALAIVFVAIEVLVGDALLQWSWYAEAYNWISPRITPLNLLLFLIVPDYLLTCAAALYARRPSLLLYGLGFLPMRLIDAVITIVTLFKVWRTKSDGRWKSPTRRGAGGREDAVVIPVASPRSGSEDGPPISTVMPPQRLEVETRDPRTMIFLDLLFAAVFFGVMATLVIVASVPILVGTFGVLLLIGVAVIGSFRSRSDR